MSKKYCMSFTAGSLLLNDSIIIASLYLALGDWDTVQKKVLSENTLQARTLGTLKRMYSELSLRLKKLSLDEITFLVNSRKHDQIHILWIAICRSYRLIAEFSTEVVREHFLLHKHSVTYDDFTIFFNAKSEWSTELDGLSDSTRYKIRQVLFKMLRDANILNKENIIIPVSISQGLVSLMDPQEILFFPYLIAQLKGLDNA